MFEMRIFKKIAVITALLLVFLTVVAGCSTNKAEVSDSGKADYLISNNITINTIEENPDRIKTETEMTDRTSENADSSQSESEEKQEENTSTDDSEHPDGDKNNDSEGTGNDITVTYPETQDKAETEKAPASDEAAVVPQAYVRNSGNQTEDNDQDYENADNKADSASASHNYEGISGNNTKTDSDSDNYSEGTYIEISGLKDKSVQQKINSRIYQVYTDMKNDTEIPSYRGIMQDIEDDMILINTRVNILICGSFNNILSLKCMGNFTYGNPSKANRYGYVEDSVDYSKVETINFDLNTGKEILLKDLFADSADYRNYINNYIDNMTLQSEDGENVNSYYSENLSFTAPFKGITDEQKFTVDTDGINLIFDDSTPEINLCYGYYPQEIKLEPGEDSVVETRFSDGSAGIYEDEKVSYLLREIKYDINKVEETNKSINVAEETGKNAPEESNELIVECSAEYNNDMPDGVKRFIGANLFPDSIKKETINERYKQIMKNRPGRNITGSGVHSIRHGSCYGGYVSIYITDYFDFYSNDNYLDDASVYDDRVYCFGPGSAKPLELKNLFNDESDYTKVMFSAFYAQYEENMKHLYPEGTPASKKELKAIWNDAYKLIEGFEVMESSIYVRYDYEALDKILNEKYGNDDTMRDTLSASLYDFNYRNLGCDNLKIFN